ncbi:MAG: glycosyltransferase [Phycisphaerales bacterium]|nr:glycosyltransferase [Phycisphaerales bacterium]
MIYHFFAHYREPIVERLARSTVAKFTFCGDDHDYESTIKRAVFSAAVDFRPCPTKRIFRSIMWQRGIIRIALSREFDQIVLLGNPFWIATWFAAIAGRLSGKRVFFWSHGFLAPPRRLKGMLRRVFFGLAHKHLFYGRWAKQNAMDLGWDPALLHVVHNSLNIESQIRERSLINQGELTALRAELFRDPTLPIAFCSCRLQPSKKLDMLVAALATLARQGVAANLLLIGDGSSRSELERLTREAKIDAHFAGPCYDESRLARLVSASDVCVSPGFVGLTAIHSMIYGVPVVTHGTMGKQAPEVEAIIPGVTGDLFEQDNVDDLARVMRPWLDQSVDRGATRMSCEQMVENRWSPSFQQSAIEHAVLGYPADDLCLIKPK